MAGNTMSDASSSSIGGVERGESVVYDCRRRKSSCGYCKSGSRGSITHGPIDFNEFLELFLCYCFWVFCFIASCFHFFVFLELVSVNLVWDFHL